MARRPADPFAATASLRTLGEWSYSIYMVHMPIIFSFLGAQLVVSGARGVKEDPGEQTTFGFAGPATALAFVILVVFVSALSYHAIEAPARRYLNAKAARARGSSAESVGEPRALG